MRSRALLPALALLTLTPLGCALADHPTTPAAVHPASAASWADVLARPAVIEHDAVVSATWHVPLSGLLDLTHPKARAAGLEDREVDIVLPVHVLTHPTFGTYIIDTGAPAELEVGALVGLFVDELKTVRPVGEIVADHGGTLSGVLMTHMHLDHVLGLPDIAPEVPVYAGPGELEVSGFEPALTRSTYDGLLEGRVPLSTFAVDAGVEMGPIERALDVFGDGSLWALSAPGHTPGSMAYLAHTKSGPKLFVGDTSHTWWGWAHGVPPGDFTADPRANQKSLDALRALAHEVDGLEVFVGHELDGDGTGIGR